MGLVYGDNTSKQILNRHTLTHTHSSLSTRKTFSLHLQQNRLCAVNASCKENSVQLSQLYLVLTGVDLSVLMKNKKTKN